MTHRTEEQKKRRNAKDRLRRAANIEKIRAYYRAQYAKNPSRQLEASKKWAVAHPERRRKINEKYRKSNPGKIREASQKHRRKRRGQIAPPNRERPELCECCAVRKAVAEDHNHVSGAFRGWLCHLCNVGLGSLGDSTTSIKLALAYLLRTEKSS